MFVRTKEDARAAGHVIEIAGGSAEAVRYLTRDDGMGYSLSTAAMRAGETATLHYRHHWEANLVVAGSGELEEIATGRRWPLHPGVAYVVGPQDAHLVRAVDDLLVVSIFTPPLAGTVTNAADHSYAPPGSGG
jgi:L-ectoine synthase